MTAICPRCGEAVRANTGDEIGCGGEILHAVTLKEFDQPERESFSDILRDALSPARLNATDSKMTTAPAQNATSGQTETKP